jgi:hypothetical protein
VGPVPGPLLLRKSGSVGNRTRTSESVARNHDQRGGHTQVYKTANVWVHEHSKNKHAVIRFLNEFQETGRVWTGFMFFKIGVYNGLL